MLKHERAALAAIRAVLEPEGLTALEPRRTGGSHPKVDVMRGGARVGLIVLSCTPRSGDTEAANMARQKARRLLAELRCGARRSDKVG